MIPTLNCLAQTTLHDQMYFFFFRIYFNLYIICNHEDFQQKDESSSFSNIGHRKYCIVCNALQNDYVVLNTKRCLKFA